MKQIEVIIQDNTRPIYRQERWDVLVYDSKRNKLADLCKYFLESEDVAKEYVSTLRKNYEVILL